MKTHLILSGLLFLSLITFSQKVNLVIFSEDGDAFYAFVNGVKQNDKAESNVKVTGVTPNISLRIEFENKALPNLKQNMALEAGFEHTAKITRDMKKQLKLRYFGQVPLDEASNNNVPTVAYHTSENATTGNYNTATTDDNTNTTVTTTTRTTKTNTVTNNPNNIAVDVNMSGAGISMNVNTTGIDSEANVHSTTSSTVTTTTSYSNSSPKKNTTTTQPTELLTSTNSGCRAAMSQPSFDKMKQSVEAKPFSDTKMNTAKVATKNNCMSVNQVKEICKLFSMDDDKLTYAKFAYDYCVDKANYYQVSEVFSFSGTTEDLNAFLEKH